MSPEPVPTVPNMADVPSETSPAADPATARTIPDLLIAEESAEEPLASSTSLAVSAATESQLSPDTQQASAPAPTPDANDASAETTPSLTVESATTNLGTEIASVVRPLSGLVEDKTQAHADRHAPIVAHDKAHAKSATDAKPAATIIEAKTALKGKEPATEKKPLQLLELPVDVLQLIFKEFGNSNDLASIAKTCSTLYALAIPSLYASFDIVWSNSMAMDSGGRGVDALTYGLSTICLGSAFARVVQRQKAHWRQYGPNQDRPPPPGTKRGVASDPKKFLSRNYGEYTRKFSLGNGPSDDVGIYNVHRGRGKMLGTLVALSIAKMRNLETFIWDMPTGIYSDVFMALSSLPDFYPDTGECKLDYMWVRWHNNKIQFDDSPSVSRSSTPEPPRPPGMGMPGMPSSASLNFVMQGSTMTEVGIQIPSNDSHPEPEEQFSYDESDVQFPTFSVVPPVKSLTVLDIDNISYLDELAVLVYNSHARLEELRIGIAIHATSEFFVQSWDSPDLKQVEELACFYGYNRIGDRRLGGVMGILVGHLFDLRYHLNARKDADKAKTSDAKGDTTIREDEEVVTEASTVTDQLSGTVHENAGSETDADNGSSDTTGEAANNSDMPTSRSTTVEAEASSSSPPSVDHTKIGKQDGHGGLEATPADTVDADNGNASEERVLNTRLKLTKLELERVPISFFTMTSALDWTTITSLTLLGCPSQEPFWRYLRKQFCPTPAATMPPRPRWNIGARKNYQLSLKHIHTDNVRKSLLKFIKETLRPETLETLLLHRQQSLRAPMKVSIDDVFNYAVKPHHKSLRKLLINGDQRVYSASDNSDDSDEFSRSPRDWDLSRNLITYVTSGRMRYLQELSFSLSYSDWHPFLQMLPGLPNLKALHVQNISQHVNRDYSLADSAMQIADIVRLRMDMKLSYVATATKCYELIEVVKGADGSDLYGPGERSRRGSVSSSSSSSSAGSDSDDDSNHGHDHNNGSDSEDDDDAMVFGMNEFEEGMDDESDAGQMSTSEYDDEHASPTARSSRMRLSEIFFFDDKVTIFKARHGQL